MKKQPKKEESRRKGWRKREESTKPMGSLVDSYLSRLKNNPLVAIIVVVGIIIVGVAQFSGATETILNTLFPLVNKHPDLIICKIDIEDSRIDICNIGKRAAKTERLYLAWSEGKYDKPGWDHEVLIGYLPYIEFQPIQPGERLAVRVLEMKTLDKKVEFMIDSKNYVDEMDERNNCTNLQGEAILCRPNR